MESYTDLYMKKIRIREAETPETTRVHKNSRVENQWRQSKWGDLETNTTEDDNFKPTETFELPLELKMRRLSKSLSKNEALAILEKPEPNNLP